MFSFFRKKTPPPAEGPSDESTASAAAVPVEPTAAPAAPAETTVGLGRRIGSWFGLGGAPAPAPASEEEAAEAPAVPALKAPVVEAPRAERPASVEPAPSAAAPMPATPVAPALGPPAPSTPPPVVEPEVETARRGWMDRLRQGLRKTGSSIGQVFTGTRIDEALYEELESALLMADAGVKATEYLLSDLRRRVKDAKATEPAAVRGLLADALTDLLTPLQASLQVGEFTPTVIMVAGVNGAGKTTTIGKLTRHLAEARCKVLLAAADTFRAAAREQLAVWAGRNQVEIVSQEGGDPSAVTFDAVKAGQARRCDVVIADTAGRLPTQLHLMEELKKLRRTIGKAMDGAPHEVLLVVDGNTGQNALAQVKAFDEALQLTGLVVTKLDGTAKGGVLAAIALWARDRTTPDGVRCVVPVYFIGVGEQLEDLQTFDAREFSQALLGL